ncbi:MAG: hypothetical protein KAV87_10795 [Desulfobacteraceae bacterium]|nr:hypothetical protein [Desulfobacteraceae bacterium]
MANHGLSGKSGSKDFILIPVVTGECPTMHKTALDSLRVLSNFELADKYLETKNKVLTLVAVSLLDKEREYYAVLHVSCTRE